MCEITRYEAVAGVTSGKQEGPAFLDILERDKVVENGVQPLGANQGLPQRQRQSLGTASVQQEPPTRASFSSPPSNRTGSRCARG